MSHLGGGGAWHGGIRPSSGALIAVVASALVLAAPLLSGCRDVASTAHAVKSPEELTPDRLAYDGSAAVLTDDGGTDQGQRPGIGSQGVEQSDGRTSRRGIITSEEIPPDQLVDSKTPREGADGQRADEDPGFSLRFPDAEPVKLGMPGRPFQPLPAESEARAVTTATGVVLPVLAQSDEAWLVVTACQDLRFLKRQDATPLGRAHIVLDPGHGGSEVGAVSPSGLTEASLNLEVARRSRELLEAMGAVVVLTRNGDHNITTAARGYLAQAVDPALFISIHHNGGAPATGNQPGTMAFVKAGSEESRRFGGLFYQSVVPILQQAAEVEIQAYRDYARALDAFQEQVRLYDQSLQARDRALVANGQVPPEATTVPPAPPTSDGYRLPSRREPVSTTTIPPTVDEPVPVPDTIAPPPPFVGEPVPEFKFAGSGNRGVRAWIRPDGADYLSVLRHSSRVPAVLVEYLYLTNPAEERLLTRPGFVDAEAQSLVDAVVEYFSTPNQGTGHVEDQYDDQPIGGGGKPDDCVEPALIAGE